MAMLLQWLAEQIKIDDKGIHRYRVVLGWQHWSWSKITQVHVDGDFFLKKIIRLKFLKNTTKSFLPRAAFTKTKVNSLEPAVGFCSRPSFIKPRFACPPMGWMNGLRRFSNN